MPRPLEATDALCAGAPARAADQGPARCAPLPRARSGHSAPTPELLSPEHGAGRQPSSRKARSASHGDAGRNSAPAPRAADAARTRPETPGMRGACAGDPACLWCPDGVPAVGRGKGLWALARPAGRQRVAPAPGVAARRGARWAPPACRSRPDGVPAVGPRGAGRWALASFLLRQVGVSKLSDKARGTCASRVAAASCVWNAHACDISVCTCSPSCGQRFRSNNYSIHC